MTQKNAQQLLEEGVILSTEEQQKVVDIKTKINEFLDISRPENLSEEEKDNLYGEAKDMWEEYRTCLQSLDFQLRISGEAWNYLETMLKKKLEYDQQGVFVALKVKELFLDKVSNINNNDEVHLIPIDITSVTLIHHLLEGVHVKGLNKDTYMFANVLTSLSDISKIYNMYDQQSQEISTRIMNWNSGLENDGKDEAVENTEETPVVELQDN